MYLAVKNVKTIEDYKLILIFEDGSVRVFDVSPLLEKGIFKELNDEVLFKTVKINFDTVEWVNGVDIDPEALYEDSTPLQRKIVTLT